MSGSALRSPPDSRPPKPAKAPSRHGGEDWSRPAAVRGERCLLKIERRAAQASDVTNPAAESIDDALARLARRDRRLNPVAPPERSWRTGGRVGVSRNRLWVVLRWLVIPGAAWFVWRLIRDGTA